MEANESTSGNPGAVTDLLDLPQNKRIIGASWMSPLIAVTASRPQDVQISAAKCRTALRATKEEDVNHIEEMCASLEGIATPEQTIRFPGLRS